MKTTPRFLGLCAAGLLTLASAPTKLSAAIVFADDYSNNSVTIPTYSLAPGVTWSVISGSFTADGSATTPANDFPEAGMLNFSPQGGTSIGVNFAGALGVIPSSPITLSFRLRNSNATNANYAFQTRLIDSSTGVYQSINFSTNPEFYGSSGVALFEVFAPGEGGYYVQTGTGGASFPASTDFQQIAISFNPVSGLTQVLFNSVEVLSYNSQSPIPYTSVDRLEFRTSDISGVSWFVDDVAIDTAMVPEPTQLALLGFAGLVVGSAALRRSRPV